MSKVLIERLTLEELADAIRYKTQSSSGMRVSDMKTVIGTLHGYVSTAGSLSADPKAYPETVFSIGELSFISDAAETNE